MDPMISLGQKNTLAEYMILSGADNRPPMLDKDLYDSWKSRMELYMQNREHGRMILESVENGPLIWPTVEENGVIRTKKYVELSAAEKIQADCDMKATNIILQGLPADIYSLVNHHRVAKDLWERVQLLMQGESLHTYYLRFTQLINDMNIYKMKMEQFQVNTKFLNSLPPEWSKFVTDVKLVKDLHTSNFDQLHAYLEQHELHANEVHYMLKTIIHAQTIQKRLDDKKLQIQECTVQEVKALDAISEDKAKKSCMVSFRKLHSHLKHLSHDNLKGTRIESGFKRAFATLFGQDVETFIGTMFLNVDQLEKQLDKEEFQEIGSIASFKVLETQFQMFIKSRMYLDDEFVVMTRNYFLQYTQLAIPEFRDTLIQHMESVKKSIDERAQHKREYDSWVNERQIQTTEGKVDTGKAVDANTRPIYDEELMAEVQTTAEIIIFATGQQHTEQPKFNNEGKVDQNAEQCHDTYLLPAKLTDNQTTELSNQSLEYENILTSNEPKVKHAIDVIETINIELEHKVAKLLKENETLKRHYKEMFDSIKTTRAKNIEHTTSLIANNDKFKAQLQEKGFAIAALKNELRKLIGNSVNTKFAKLSILGKPALQPRRNQSVVRQPTAFKSERPRISKQRFASQVDVNNDLSKPVTTHYLPKERESAVAKPHHMIAPGSSRYSSNDMVHNHYLEEAKKKTQESCRNSEPSVMPSARSQSTTNGSKPKLGSNTQKSRNCPALRVDASHQILAHIRSTLGFLEVFLTPKHFRKILNSSTTKVDSDPTNGSDADITNLYECKQTLDGFKEFSTNEQAMMSDHNSSDLAPQRQETSVANDTSGLVPQRQKASDYDNPDPAPELQNVSPSADTTVPSQQELDLLFGPLYDEFFNDGTSRVNKSSSPTDNSAPQDTHHSTNIHPTSEPSTPTNVHAEENNDNQAEFTNPFCTPVKEIV
ncbi:hypothetical protein Tco_0533591 [Tanacetum coccineum]